MCLHLILPPVGVRSTASLERWCAAPSSVRGGSRALAARELGLRRRRVTSRSPRSLRSGRSFDDRTEQWSVVPFAPGQPDISLRADLRDRDDLRTHYKDANSPALKGVAAPVLPRCGVGGAGARRLARHLRHMRCTFDLTRTTGDAAASDQSIALGSPSLRRTNPGETRRCATEFGVSVCCSRLPHRRCWRRRAPPAFSPARSPGRMACRCPASRSRPPRRRSRASAPRPASRTASSSCATCPPASTSQLALEGMATEKAR